MKKRLGLSVSSFVTVLLLVVTVGDSTTISLVADERPALPYPKGIKPESICGTTDDLQDVELYDGTLGVTREYVASHQSSTVQLQWKSEAQISGELPGHAVGNIAGRRWCSGTLIGDDLVLTAGHCFDIQSGANGWFSPFTIVDGQPKYAPASKLAKLQVVNFLYQINGDTGSLREALSFPIVELLEYRKLGLDYALIKLGVNENGDLPTQVVVSASHSDRQPSSDERIAVIQHPQGWPKKVEAGHVKKLVGAWVWYDDIDTYGASSGSAVRDSEGQVIAVHTNGGCNTIGGNRGISVEAIVQASELLSSE